MLVKAVEDRRPDSFVFFNRFWVIFLRFNYFSLIKEMLFKDWLSSSFNFLYHFLFSLKLLNLIHIFHEFFLSLSECRFCRFCYLVCEWLIIRLTYLIEFLLNAITKRLIIFILLTMLTKLRSQYTITLILELLVNTAMLQELFRAS